MSNTISGMDLLSILTVFLLLSSSLFSLSESHKVKRTKRVVVELREFDYFLLALQWRGTICHNTKHCCASNGCCSSNATSDFTIHGLWTNYNDGTWPACCNGAEFNIKEISTLLGGLNKYWPSLSCSSSSTCHGSKGLFWAHEWEKHGTCAFPIFRDEYSYFVATLNLYLKYNVTEMLAQEGYVPSNYEKYPLGGIVSAIQNVVRATPKIVCSHGAIQELYICFYKNFEPRDCVDTVSSGATGYASSSCPKYVSLPEYGPPSLASGSTSRSSRWGAI